MISDENLAQLKAMVTEVVTQVVTDLLKTHGMKPLAVLKNAAAAERMRRYRENKRNAERNGKRNGVHSAKRNAERNPERNAEAIQVLEFLNQTTHKKYPPVKATIDLIAARLDEGFTPVQLRQIVLRKSREWGSDPKMQPFLRPKTIFGKTNAANYAGDLVPHD